MPSLDPRSLATSELMELLRDTTFGSVVYHLSGQRYLNHVDERDPSVVARHIDWERPVRWTDSKNEKDSKNLVNFSEDDLENPQNWSAVKKRTVVLAICYYTTSVYSGAALWSSCIDDAVEIFGAPEVIVQLGTSLFLWGLGLGAMITSPLTEIPALGSRVFYVSATTLFVVFQLVLVLSENLPTILVFRFLTGLFASPCMSLPGASMKAMYQPQQVGIPVALWDTAQAAGSFVFPLIGNYAAQYRGYRWPMWVSLWFSASALMLILCVLPETSHDHILYRRARRLRKHIGNENLKGVAESNFSDEAAAIMIKNAAIKAIALNFQEPVVLVLNTYLALVFSLMFAALESYVVVFVDIYGFSAGQEGLAFLGLAIGFGLSALAYYWFYMSYQRHQFNPEGRLQPEKRLIPAFVSSVTIPTGLFWYGWSARTNVHWIMPIIGGSFLGPAAAGLFFSILNYLPDAYPRVSSTVLAGSGLIRCLLAGAFPLFITPLYQALGPGWASSIWAFLGCLFAPAPFILYLHGHKIRQRSNNAEKDF